MLQLSGEIKLSSKKIRSIVNDPVKTAAAASLKYVSDTHPGIQRIKRGTSFRYVQNGRPLRDKKMLERIKDLVIPPAWENVWICSDPFGHLQVTGIDAKGRKQYRYHSLWNHLRNHTKFYRLTAFGEVLPRIRKQLEKDLVKPGLPMEKVLALIVTLMQETSIRIGNQVYEKLYGSFGLTTMKDSHVKIKGSQMKFIFRGKKGVAQCISLKSARLARMVKQCRDIPGKELFQYYDENGERKTIDSGMVNDYIQQISGEDFTAKDFRTWAGTLRALCELAGCCTDETMQAEKKKITEAIDEVARHLGNTRTVCRKYYIHPLILDLYENGKLHRYAKMLDGWGEPKDHLTVQEQILMKILYDSESGTAASVKLA
jgi:DNA topoisomerase I